MKSFADAATIVMFCRVSLCLDVGIIGVSFVNDLPPNMVRLEFDKQRGLSTSLYPFFVHFGSLFSFIFVFGFYMYAANPALEWRMLGSTIVTAIVFCVALVVPGYYGDRLIFVTEVDRDIDVVHRNRLANSDDNNNDNNSKRVSKSLAEKDLTICHDSSDTTNRCEEESRAEDEIAKALDQCYYGSSIPLSRSITTWRFWVLYFAFLTMCGTGLMVIDNINTIAEAVGTTPSTFFVTCVSLANSLGRVCAGYTSDRLVGRYSRLQMMSCVALFAALFQGLFAIGSEWLLYPCLLSIGGLFGCNVALIAVIVPDIFGGKHVATNFGAIDSAPIFGSYIFVTGLISLVYTVNAVDDGGDESCVGADCFRNAFIVNSVCCGVVAIALYGMHLYTPIKSQASH